MPGPLGPGRSARVAVVGAGIAGLGAAWQLRRLWPRLHLTLFEAGAHFGGHAHTQTLTLEGIPHGVDTGFLVYNARTYPRLIELFGQLQVDTAPSEMSFSVQAHDQRGHSLEYSGSNLSTLFAQRRNLLHSRFWGMLADIVRFNRLATALALGDAQTESALSVADFLRLHGFGAAFRDDYLLPMIACIWSCPLEQMLHFPMASLIRFCHNHGLLQVRNRPQWYTVRGGSRHYVDKIVAQLDAAHLHTPVLALQRGPDGVQLHSRRGREAFDAVVLACHPDQALRLLGEAASAQERAVLGALRYQSNVALLHTDASQLPQRRAAWAAWNYERGAKTAQAQTPVCLHYLLNRLQPLPWRTPVLVTLNPIREIDPAHIHARMHYSHPVFDAAALAAQAQVAQLQGQQRTWFCGAWCGYGFHEDGLRAGQEAAQSLLQALSPTPAGPHSAMASA